MTMTLEPTCEANSQPARTTGYIKPRVNILENREGYVISAEMPGVAKDGIEVTVEDGHLTIFGRRSEPTREGSPLHLESRQVDYHRVFDFADDIDTNAISAKLNQGILTVTLAKREQVKPRRIEVGG